MNTNYLKKMIVPSAISVTLMIGWSSTCVADVYKWKDDKGVIHYTEHPPKDRESTVMKTSHKRSSAPYIPAASKDKAASAPATTEPEKTAEEKKQDKKYCAQARQNLKTLKEHARIRKENAKGELEVLSPEKKQAEIDQANRAISDYCNK